MHDSFQSSGPPRAGAARGRAGAFLAVLLSGCIFATAPGKRGPDASLNGYREIPSRDRSFREGSDGTMAGPDEKPVMPASFSYDFTLDTVEVTQGMWRTVMGREAEASAKIGRGDSFPVYNVSWFDAAVFCNRRSVMQGFDTVYEYSGIEQGEGGVYGLTNLAVHLERKGFRLPTEAEWEFSARAGSAGDFPWGGLADSASARDYAWYSANASDSLHPVASLKPNAFGLYDMAGNVMEWVNDWKGPYVADTTRDFAGARSPGPGNEIPVKGGAFRYGLRELRPANRSAAYPTIPSTSGDYVGFRCALGGIPKPAFISADGIVLRTDPVHLDIARLAGYVGGRRAKLAFINATPLQRSLVYVDYGQYPPKLQEFTDTVPVFYPRISPDGEWVAFGTAAEGSEKNSSVYVRKLGEGTERSRKVGEGFIPRWWVDPATRDTFLICTNSAVDDANPRWAATQTFMLPMKGGSASGSPVPVSIPGGYHDGRSLDGRRFATGFRYLRAYDQAARQESILFTGPGNGKEAGDTSQVCNVSMAPDSSGRMLFLDFGYNKKSALTGIAYNVHEIAFMADPAGRVLRWFKVPAEENGWEELEWSNVSDFAVSAANDPAQNSRHLYLLNLKDSAYIKLATGTLLTQPSLWLDAAPDSVPVAGLDLDSLGHYDDPATTSYQANFAGKMLRYWEGHEDFEMVFMGSSHVMGGIAPQEIKSMRAFNFGVAACGWLCTETLTRDYVLNQSPKLKVLALEVFAGWMILPGGDKDWATSMGKTKGFLYDQSHGFWKDGLPFGFGTLVGAAPGTNSEFDSAGGVRIPSGSWGPNPLSKNMSNDWGADDPRFLETFASMKSLVQELADRKIHVVLINYPESPAYKQSDYYQRYGPGWPAAREVIKKFRSLEEISPYIHFYDAYNFADHDYTDADAQNWDHLSYAGALKLTRRIDSLVATFH